MRLIDKDALLDQLKELLKKKEEEAAYAGRRESTVSFGDAITTIKNAPTIEPEPQWIPCSERLPDTDDHVLCCTETKSGGKNIVIGYYTSERWACGMNSNVIAWMPLPEPYDGDRND